MSFSFAFPDIGFGGGGADVFAALNGDTLAVYENVNEGSNRQKQANEGTNITACRESEINIVTFLAIFEKAEKCVIQIVFKVFRCCSATVKAIGILVFVIGAPGVIKTFAGYFMTKGTYVFVTAIVIFNVVFVSVYNPRGVLNQPATVAHTLVCAMNLCEFMS